MSGVVGALVEDRKLEEFFVVVYVRGILGGKIDQEIPIARDADGKIY